MPKISWNDINDSDSSLSSGSQEPQPIPIPKDKQVSVQPIQQSKLKNACDKVSLTKLESHQKDEVWLFVPNSFYERADEVHGILEQCKQIKQLIRAKGVGWNILTDYYDAKTLISQGIIQEEISIKFIYSTRNDNKPPQAQEKQKPPKMQKKVTYVEKVNNLPQLQRNISATDEIPRVQELKKEEKIQVLKELKSDKPKVKWVQKPNNRTTIDEKKSYVSNNERLQSPRSPRLYRNANEVKSPKRYVQKIEKNMEKKESQIVEVKSQVLEQIKNNQRSDKIQSAVSDVLKSNPVSQETIQIQSPKPCLEKQKEQENDLVSQPSSSDVQEQPKKKKNKKKKKAKNGPKNDKRDPNNPFSFFAQ